MTCVLEEKKTTIVSLLYYKVVSAYTYDLAKTCKGTKKMGFIAFPSMRVFPCINTLQNECWTRSSQNDSTLYCG